MQDRVIIALRAQAWARAKGELEAFLQTYWDCTNNEQCDRASKLVKEFIAVMEGEYE